MQGNAVCGRKAGGDARFQLRRERDLRHHHERLAATRQHAIDELQIDLGLAAAGHAVEQERSVFAEVQYHCIHR